MDGTHATDGKQRRRRKPGPGLVGAHLAVAGVIVAAAAATSGLDHWRLGQLLIIVALTVTGDLLSVEAGDRLFVSGTSLGVMLALIVQGPAPAIVVGVSAMLAGWFRSREPLTALLHNVVNHAGFALAGGLTFYVGTHAMDLAANDLAYYLLVFGVFIEMLVLNFVGAAGYQCYIDRTSLIVKAREALFPLLAAHLFSAVLTITAVYIVAQTGTVGIVVVGLTLAIFQYLIGELMKSKRRGEALQVLATTDTLTGLVNRDHFNDELTKVINSTTGDASFAVLLIDLDRFKEINDTLGHHYGDELLRQLGPRLERAAGRGGVVARLGGDEFAVLPATRVGDTETLERLATEIVACIQESFLIDDLALEVGASIGIARFPQDGRDANTLLRCADVAMYTAKEAHAGWKFYAAEFDRNSVRKLSVLSDFRRALAEDELVVYYQPIVDVAGSRVRGAEALVRWDHPTLGLLAPGAFVDTVEQTGLIGPMTRHVLERAVHQCVEWRRDGRELSVAVNLSVRNLLDRNLPTEIDRLLSVYGLPPEALQLEITESMLMSDPERMLATVTRLNALGVRLSVDDFGTGYSSLANLRSMPIDELKIDRSFVSPMLRDESDLIIVRSTINLGHDLGMRVIAEGVEDEETLTRLARLGCDLAQGYHLSRPMPSEQFVRWLDEDARPDLVLAV
jgi:diguanylate cyclase (GGDEF)-like protein